MWELCGVEISAFPLTWHIAHTTACCYRTSRDGAPKIMGSRVWPYGVTWSHRSRDHL